MIKLMLIFLAGLLLGFFVTCLGVSHGQILQCEDCPVLEDYKDLIKSIKEKIPDESET